MTDEQLRSWRCDDAGRCWTKCPAAEASATATRIECLVIGEIYSHGWPCPVRRLQLALGLATAKTVADAEDAP